MTSSTNRPKKPHIGEKFIPIAQDNEVTTRTVSDANGNPVYHARAKVGSLDTDANWQIMKITWDSSGYHQHTKWPEENSIATQEYNFVWDDAPSVAVSGITQANPGVVTCSSAHGFSNGDSVVFENITGMTELEWGNRSARIYKVANKDSTTFEITDQDGSNVDTSGYGAFVSGTVTKPDFANYTYS